MATRRKPTVRQSRRAGISAARLGSLLEAASLLNSTLDLEKLLSLILNLAIANVRAARGTIYLVDHERKELWSKILKARRPVEIRVPLGTGIAGHVALSGETVNLKDVAQDSRVFHGYEQRFGFLTRTMLCMPMRNRAGRIIGVIQMLNKRSGRFTSADETFLRAFSDQVALAVENARYHQAVVEKERAERELQIAATIQESLLPREWPPTPGYELSATTRAAQTVGGDYYTVAPLDCGRSLLAVADAAGKGVPASLLVSMLHAALHVQLVPEMDLPELFARLNAFIHRNIVPGRYITLVAAQLDPANHLLTTINAGHPPPCVVPGNGGATRVLAPGGFPLGLMPDATYEVEEVKIEPGDTVVLYSDGVTEAMDVTEREFGAGRLEQSLRRARGGPASAVQRQILEDIRAFADSRAASDDLTLLVLRRER